MKKLSFNYVEGINKICVEDLLELTKYIAVNYNLYITSLDAYNFWRKVSLVVFDSNWLEFTNIPEPNRREILEKYIPIYCSVKE